MRICVISVHYYADYVERSIKALNALCAVLNPTNRILVSNNADITARLRHESSGEVIEHDNSGSEFGAYQAGMDRAITTCAEADWYVVLNDTFSIHECFAKPLRDNFVQAVVASGDSSIPIIVGQVDETPRSFLIGGVRTHRWVRSNVMALNSVAAQVLGRRLYQPEADAWITASGDVDEFFSAELDPVLRERISTWIFSRNANGWGWYKAAELTSETSRRLALKARSILQEKYLSARLEGASAVFLNIKQMPISSDIRRGIERHLFLWRNRLRSWRPAESVSSRAPQQ